MRTKYAVLSLILLLYLILSSSILTIGHNWGGDFSAYIMQASSVLEGTTSRYIEQNSFTINNSSRTLGPIIYPWGYPILILPAIYFFGINFWAMKAINILFYLLFLVCVYLLFASRLSVPKRLVLLALLAFSPAILTSHDNVLADIPFLCFSTLSFFMIDMFIISEKKFISQNIDYFLLGLTIFFAFWTRTSGAILLLVLLISQIVHRFKTHKTDPLNKTRIFHNLLPYLTFLTLLGLTTLTLSSDNSSYFSHLDHINFLQALKHMYRYTLLLPTFLHILSYESGINLIIFVVLLPFLLMGIGARWRTDYHFILYSGFTLGLYFLWPYFQGLRFIFPVLPFYIYFVFIGWEWLGSSLPRRSSLVYQTIGHYLLLFVVMIVFVSSLSLAVQNLRSNREIEGPFDPLSTEMFQFISKNTKDGSTIVFFKPRVLKLITDRNSYIADNCANLLKGHYLVVHKEYDKNWNPFEELIKCNSLAAFQLIFNNQKFMIYRISKP
jgi:hypothetical protein